MQTLKIKWRNWFKGIPPRPIKLEIPGWAGEKSNHGDGDKPQPWFCPPFVEGATYGLELLYPFDTECHVKIVNGKLFFECDFSEENKDCPYVELPPFSNFAPGHFGMTSSLDIEVPPGYVLRTEPHPRYYTDITNTVPCCIPGHLQTEWWPKIFFVVFKNPMPGQTLIFRKGEPYGQVLVVPRQINYEIKEMTSFETAERLSINEKMNNCSKNFINNNWIDNVGNNFDDKYKVLRAVFNKNGSKGVIEFLKAIETKLQNRKKIIGKLIIKKNESI